jgi:hypothetical protein
MAAQDELGNPADLPGAVTFTVDDPSIVTLTDNGDGSGEIAATGTLGVTTLTGTVTLPDGSEVTGVAAVQVVSGDASTFSFDFGDPEEVTPDGTEPTA